MEHQSGRKTSTPRKQINERRVKALLAERGWTQDDLALAVGVTSSYINRIICNRQQGKRHVAKIAEALDVPPRRILQPVPFVSASSDQCGPAALAAAPQG